MTDLEIGILVALTGAACLALGYWYGHIQGQTFAAKQVVDGVETEQEDASAALMSKLVLLTKTDQVFHWRCGNTNRTWCGRRIRKHSDIRQWNVWNLGLCDACRCGLWFSDLGKLQEHNDRIHKARDRETP